MLLSFTNPMECVIGRYLKAHARRMLVFPVGSSARGRFPPAGRGGFRNDSFRGRGNYGGGRSFGRSEYVSRGEFSGRGRGGPARRGGDVYQVRGRGGRSSEPKQNAVSA